MMLTFAFLIFALAIALLWQSYKRQQAAGLPGGRVIYTDTSEWGVVEQPLHDPVVGLTGKPDYLVKQGDGVVPVEVKSGRTPDAPYDSHIYQLAAYCVLVQREYGVRPGYGILHYPNRTFAVDFSTALESALLDLLVDVRRMERKRDVPRSHEAVARCRGCGYKNECDQRL